MDRVQILYPVLAMVALAAFVVVRLAASRVRAVERGEVPLEYYALFRGEEEPERLRAITRHLANQFEFPVLFYVVCLAAYVTAQVDALMVILAWLFVVARYVHSYIHLTSNTVLQRFRAFGASFVALLLLWIVLAVRIVARGAGVGS
jgi:hypothetical protein